MCRISRSPSKPCSATRQMRPRLRGEESPGGVFVLRADLIPPESRPAGFRRPRRDPGAARRPVRAARPDRRDSADADARREPHAKRPSRRTRRRPKRRPDTRILQWARRFRAGRPGICDRCSDRDSRRRRPGSMSSPIARFGFQVGAEGSGYTWSVNSRENQLTPWSNDPVADRPGEAFYLRDEETGDLWSPTALPIRDRGGDLCRPSRPGLQPVRAHLRTASSSNLLQFVPLDDADQDLAAEDCAICRGARGVCPSPLMWNGCSARRARRRLPFVTTALDPRTGAMFARNRWSADFGGRVAFADLGRAADATGPATAANSSAATARSAIRRLWPAAAPCPNSVGAGLDPCARAADRPSSWRRASRAKSSSCWATPRMSREARTLIARYRSADLDAVFAEVGRHWDEHSGRRPGQDARIARMDIMLNGWLLYQTLACRIWARAAFYQASGAYGFRDQLQDVHGAWRVAPADRARAPAARGGAAVRRGRRAALVAAAFRPGRAHAHLGRPCSGWPYAVGQYIEVTGDAAVLDENGRLPGGPRAGADGARQLLHCRRLRRDRDACSNIAPARSTAAWRVGAHGLPLIGAGDWNDGMNRVGAAGPGRERLARLVPVRTLIDVSPLSPTRAAKPPARQTGARMRPRCKASLEREAWDGDWYRRGYFDDGTPLGSAPERGMPDRFASPSPGP